MRLRRCVSWTARGDEDVDAKRFETVDRKTREVPREERTRGYDWDRSADHIRARSQSGCIQRPDTWLHPNDFAEMSDSFPLHCGRRPYMAHRVISLPRGNSVAFG